MEKAVNVFDSSLIREVFGVGDRKAVFLEDKLGVIIKVKSQGLVVKGSKTGVDKAVHTLNKLLKLAKDGVSLNQEELKQYFKSVPMRSSESCNYSKINIPAKKKSIFPKTDGQNRYIEAIERSSIVFSIGPAGTGKTYLAMAMAANYLMLAKVNRIILTRPAIEAGESLVFYRVQYKIN